LVAEVMADMEMSSLSSAEKTMLRFVDKVNQDSPNVSPDDVQTLYEAGWDDEQIYYAITVCALFNFYNRWIDATGVHAMSEEAHRQGGARMAVEGYTAKG
jgi:alkylhydroperoxidase family enzyme